MPPNKNSLPALVKSKTFTNNVPTNSKVAFTNPILRTPIASTS